MTPGSLAREKLDDLAFSLSFFNKMLSARIAAPLVTEQIIEFSRVLASMEGFIWGVSSRGGRILEFSQLSASNYRSCNNFLNEAVRWKSLCGGFL